MNYKTNALALGMLVAVALTGCGTGTKINANGSTNQARWSNPSRVTFDKNQGTFPNLQSLEQVKSGMTKDQLYELLGRPQYNNGWRPREWNYLFNFHTPGQGVNGVTTCQFKVTFDNNMYARNFYWNAVSPKGATCPAIQKPVAPQPPVQQVQPKVQRYVLNADTLFNFNKSDLRDLSGRGQAVLNELVSKLTVLDHINVIRIVGYTDRLGSEVYNQLLSQRRADTIRQFLISRGVPENMISATGAGENNPVKECHETNRAKLIDCLQPNRRVEVEVEGYGVDRR